MEEQKSTSKKRPQSDYLSRVKRQERRKKILEEVKEGKQTDEIIKKNKVGKDLVYRLKRNQVMKHIQKGAGLKEITQELNMSLERVREIRDSHIELELIRGTAIDKLAEDLLVDKQEIEVFRNKMIEKELFNYSPVEVVATKWHLSNKEVFAILENAIRQHAMTKRLEEVAHDFQLSVHKVLLMLYHIPSRDKIFKFYGAIDRRALQLKKERMDVLTRLKKGGSTKDIAKELKMSEGIVKAIRNLQIEKEYRKKHTTETISKKFHMSKDRVREIRNMRILRQRDEGKSIEILAQNYNRSKSLLRQLIQFNIAGMLPTVNSELIPKKKVVKKFDVFDVSDEVKQKIITQLKSGESVKDIAVRFGIKMPVVFSIRNKIIFKMLSENVTAENIAKKLKMSRHAVHLTIARHNIAEFPKIKRQPYDFLSVEQAKSVRKLIKEGQGNAQISKSLGVKPTLVRSMRKRMNSKKKPTQKYKRVSEETKKKILSDLEKLSVTEVSFKYKVSRATIRALEKRYLESKMKESLAEQHKEQNNRLKNIEKSKQVAINRAKFENIKKAIHTPSSRARPIKGKQRSFGKE
ncbi:MAG: hypothetical protein ACI32O_11425 [Enterococcus sp.]